jgi:hypothetical protein
MQKEIKHDFGHVTDPEPAPRGALFLFGSSVALGRDHYRFQP